MAKKAKKRTKAERSAAAKLMWARRRAAAKRFVFTKPFVEEGSSAKAKAHAPKAANSPDKSMALSALANIPMELNQVASGHPLQVSTAIPAAVKEGDDIYLMTSHRDGSHSRQRITETGARKLLRELSGILL